MTTSATQFALIGQSHSSDVFLALHNVGLSTRASRSGVRPARVLPLWRASGEPVVLPSRLRA